MKHTADRGFIAVSPGTTAINRLLPTAQPTSTPIATTSVIATHVAFARRIEVTNSGSAVDALEVGQIVHPSRYLVTPVEVE